MKNQGPLLAEKVDLDLVQYPVMTSDKYDGFRCLIHPALGPITRSWKPLANNYVRGKLAELPIQWCDGELMTYTAGKADDFNTIQSKLTSRQGMPDFIYHVFDTFMEPKRPFKERLQFAHSIVSALDNTRVMMVQHDIAEDLDNLLEWERRALLNGYEGLMIRKIDGPYKFGRSTVKEGILLKLKRTDEDEGTIVGGYERMINGNEATINELGYTERSSHQENMIPAGDLGGFTVSWRGLEFGLGTGFGSNQRISFYNDIDEIIGKQVTFAYQGVGSNGKPRFPRFRGIRGDL